MCGSGDSAGQSPNWVASIASSFWLARPEGRVSVMSRSYALVVGVTIAACFFLPRVGLACTSDMDCKGDRVCDEGACVDPKPGPSTAASNAGPTLVKPWHTAEGRNSLVEYLQWAVNEATGGATLTLSVICCCLPFPRNTRRHSKSSRTTVPSSPGKRALSGSEGKC